MNKEQFLKKFDEIMFEGLRIKKLSIVRGWLSEKLDQYKTERKIDVDKVLKILVDEYEYLGKISNDGKIEMKVVLIAFAKAIAENINDLEVQT